MPSLTQHRMMPVGRRTTNQDTDRLPREVEELPLFAVFKTPLRTLRMAKAQESLPWTGGAHRRKLGSLVRQMQL